MKYLRSKVVGISMVLLLSMTLLPIHSSYAKSCADKKEDCNNECEEVFEGDHWTVQWGQVACKGACQVGYFVCQRF